VYDKTAELFVAQRIGAVAGIQPWTAVAFEVDGLRRPSVTQDAHALQCAGDARRVRVRR